MNKSYIHIILGVVFTLFLFIRPGMTQTGDEWKHLRKEIDKLKESQKTIQKDLQEIKNALQMRGLLPEEPQNLIIDLSNKPFKGKENAKLLIIEFSEYQ